MSRSEMEDAYGAFIGGPRQRRAHDEPDDWLYEPDSEGAKPESSACSSDAPIAED